MRSRLCLVFGLLALPVVVLSQPAMAQVYHEDSWAISPSSIKQIVQLNASFLQSHKPGGGATMPRGRRGARGQGGVGAAAKIDAKTFLVQLQKLAFEGMPKGKVPPKALKNLETLEAKVTLTPQQEQEVLKIAQTAAQKFQAGAKPGGGGGAGARQRRGGAQGLLPYMEQSNLLKIVKEEVAASFTLTNVLVTGYD